MLKEYEFFTRRRTIELYLLLESKNINSICRELKYNYSWVHNKVLKTFIKYKLIKKRKDAKKQEHKYIYTKKGKEIYDLLIKI